MLPFIHTAETFYGPGADLRCRPSERAFLLHTPREFPLLQPLLTRRGEIDDTHQAIANVERGMWIAQCPFCASAQVVTPREPLYLCAGDGGCANLAVAGAFIPITFPSPLELRRIERALLKRPHMHNRNWLIHETVDQLHAENIEHGLEKA